MLDCLGHKGWHTMRTAPQSTATLVRTTNRTLVTPTLILPSRGFSGQASISPFRQTVHQLAHPRSRQLFPLQRRSLHFSYDFANRPGPKHAQARKAKPLDEITRLRELINRANSANSKLSKERILAEFDDLIPLLAFLYDPYTRLHVTSSTVHNYLRQRGKDIEWQNNQAPLMSVPSNRSRDKTRAAALRAKQEQDVREQTPVTLLELFQLLASRYITGHEALAVIRIFLDQHGIIEQHDYALSGFDDPNISTTELFRRGLLRPTSLEIFYRCLDRNLKAGFGERILRQAFAASFSSSSERTSNGGSNKQCRGSQTPTAFRGSFEVALGKTVTRAEIPTLFASKNVPCWHVSRKLDGVRCLFVVRLQQEQADDSSAKWKVVSVMALSRSGRPFSTLGVLEQELSRTLPSYPGLSDLLDSAHSSRIQDHDAGQAPTASLVLDGEVCILQPPELASTSAIKHMDANITDPSQESQEQTMVEDFAAVVGLIKRKNYTIPEPAFFPFDLLSLDEFTQWRSPVSDGKQGRTFSKRLQSLKPLVAFFEAAAREQRKQSLIRQLSQHIVLKAEDVEALLATASTCGWEGLVLRQDTVYEGKRTSAIRKFKEWKDAEYTVQGVSIATMRLPVAGRFEEREAMASIQIKHKGTWVSVGSGFTPEQRIEFAMQPDKIVGKVVTVEYFDESKTIAPTSPRNGAASRTESTDEKETPNEVYSLRFPRIKQIWEEERDI